MRRLRLLEYRHVRRWPLREHRHQVCEGNVVCEDQCCGGNGEGEDARCGPNTRPTATGCCAYPDYECPVAPAAARRFAAGGTNRTKPHHCSSATPVPELQTSLSATASYVVADLRVRPRGRPNPLLYPYRPCPAVEKDQL